MGSVSLIGGLTQPNKKNTTPVAFESVIQLLLFPDDEA